nr:L-lysine 2,3-aminomutase [Chlamydiota bacterium]
HGVIPYYLHQLDRVKQASHFEVSIQKGRELIQELRERLPGYAVPTYVQELPFKAAKSPITPLSA